jgi:heme A synthase
VRLRTVQPQKFAKNELPGWLFPPYPIFILLALASFGVAFWLQGTHRVLGAGIFLGALLVLGLFLKFKDMPPFVYYAITLAIGLALLF